MYRLCFIHLILKFIYADPPYNKLPTLHTKKKTRTGSAFYICNSQMNRCRICLFQIPNSACNNQHWLHIQAPPFTYTYRVAMMSRLLEIIGLFCKRALWKRRYSAKETYNLKEPTQAPPFTYIFDSHIYMCRLRLLPLLTSAYKQKNLQGSAFYIYNSLIYTCRLCLLQIPNSACKKQKHVQAPPFTYVEGGAKKEQNVILKFACARSACCKFLQQREQSTCNRRGLQQAEPTLCVTGGACTYVKFVHVLLNLC